MEKVISFENVSKEYGDAENKFFALDDISFDINKGELVVILGPSGAGKSTLLNLLGGMDNATSGKIYVNENNITTFDDDALTQFRADNVGFVFQFYNLIPSLTAYENIALTKDIKSEVKEAMNVLRAVKLEKRANNFPSQLSGGEQQRVSIARAISKNPLMLLCDEPTGALDSKTGVEILKLLQKLSIEENKTVIIVTHNVTIAKIANRIIHLKNGKIEKNIVNDKAITVDEVSW